MKLLNSAPFVRLLFPFIFGILTSIYSSEQSSILIFALVVLFVAFVLYVAFPRIFHTYRNSWVAGILINSTLFCAGFYLTVLQTQCFDKSHFSNYLDSTDCFYVKALKPPIEKEKSVKVMMEVLAVKQSEIWKNTTGRAMFYFQKDSSSQQIKYGDCLLLKAKVIDVSPPQNPSEFDYKQFLAFHSIYQQAYVSSSKWTFTRVNEGNWMLKQAFAFREKLLDIFQKNGISGNEYAVGAALILGYEDKLDQDIINSYASTGALHVLSVSGLHVGIVYIVFSWLLSFFDRIKKGNIIKAVLLLFIVWFYAMLSGLSPSVLRSATMFSFIIISNSFNKNSDIYNTLAVSCFLLLMINPFMIMEVGFQLSYLAVLGIVLIQPRLYELWETDNWLLDQIWTITTVSIAAQLVTFPLGLLYFHQFPNYFLFSNLLVIPVSTVILYLGILVFALSKVSFMVAFLSKLLSYSILFLNESVKFIEKLPYAMIQGISISVFETWLIYFMIIVLFSFFVIKKIEYLRLTLVAVILFLLIQCLDSFQESRQKKIVVYNIPKTVAYDFISGKNTVFIGDSSLTNNNSQMLFHIKHNWWDLGVDQQQIIASEKINNHRDNYLFARNGFIQFYDKRIAIVSEKPKEHKKIKVDYLILSKNPTLKIADLRNNYEFGKLIIDSSNPCWKTSRWMKEATNLNIECYSVIDSGAFQEEI